MQTPDDPIQIASISTSGLAIASTFSNSNLFTAVSSALEDKRFNTTITIPINKTNFFFLYNLIKFQKYKVFLSILPNYHNIYRYKDC